MPDTAPATLTPTELETWLAEQCRGVALPADPVGDYADARRREWREQQTVAPRTVRYFYRLAHDYRIVAMCFANAGDDAGIFVETEAPDGTLQRWAERAEGDLRVFHAPDGYLGGGVGFFCRWPVEPLPLEQLEREAMNGRHSGCVLMSSTGG